MPDNGELLARIEERTRGLPEMKARVDDTHTEVVAIKAGLAERCPARKREINGIQAQVSVVSGRVWYVVGSVCVAALLIGLKLLLG